MEKLYQKLEIQLEHEDGPGGHCGPGDQDAGSFQILLLPVKGQTEDKFIFQDAGHQRWCGIAFLNKRRRASLILYKLRVFRLLTLGTFISSSEIFRHFISRGNEFHLPADDFRPDGHHCRTAHRALLFFFRKGIDNDLFYSGSLKLFLQRGLFLTLPCMLPDDAFLYLFNIRHRDIRSFLHVKKGELVWIDIRAFLRRCSKELLPEIGNFLCKLCNGCIFLPKHLRLGRNGGMED